MPPTVKDPVLLQNAPAVTPLVRPGDSASRTEPAARPQPVCLEVPVTVRGTHVLEGENKREPFSETTRTVLVFSKGAVLRLAASIAPGQLLSLTNERTRKEIVCQVVKSKHYRNVSGYVELEFTQPVVGFWGVRFPSDKLGPGNNPAERTSAAPPLATTEVAPLPPPITSEETLAALPPPEISPASGHMFVSSAVHAEQAGVVPPVVAGKPNWPFSLLEEGQNQDKPSPPPQSGASQSATEPLSPLQDALPSQEAKHEVPAPASAPQTPPLKTLLSKEKEEEAPLPAWLTPAAYSALSTPVRPPMPSVAPKPVPPPAPKFESPLASEPAEPPEPTVPAVAAEEPAAALRHGDAALSFSLSREDKLFGNSILMDASEEEARPGASRGLLYGVIAALILLSAAGGTWWYLRFAAKPSATLASVAPAAVRRVESSPTLASAQSQTPPMISSPASLPVGGQTLSAASVVSEPAPSVPLSASMNPVKTDPAASPARENALTASKASPAPTSAAAAPARRALREKLRLSAPIVSRRARSSGASEEDLNIGGVPGAPVAGDAASFAAPDGGHPVAPRPDAGVGGNVKPARLLSSVAPVYPVMARTQRVSGDVLIDALIESNGRVSSMKVVSGHPLLQQAAMDAVRQWKYQPAMLDGKPVAMHLAVTVQFRLQR